MLRFDTPTYLSLFKLILSVRLSNSLEGSDVLLFHKYSIHFCIIPLLNFDYIVINVFNNFCSTQRICDLPDLIK